MMRIICRESFNVDVLFFIVSTSFEYKTHQGISNHKHTAKYRYAETDDFDNEWTR